MVYTNALTSSAHRSSSRAGCIACNSTRNLKKPQDPCQETFRWGFERYPAISISVGVGLEGAINLDSDVVRLRLAELRELGTKRRQVQVGNLLIQCFGQQIDIVLVTAVFLRVTKEVELA